MLERLNPVLRILCLVLAALVVAQLARLAGRNRALPELPGNDSWLLSAEMEAEPDTAKGITNSTPASRTAAGRPSPSLPANIQARVDRITQSEILGPVVRPLPMALLGIAGRDAIVRTPDGRTALLREGEELGGVKLLQIGTNRVLIEHEKQRKELMLFSGFGSDPLLPITKQDPK